MTAVVAKLPAYAVVQVSAVFLQRKSRPSVLLSDPSSGCTYSAVQCTRFTTVATKNDETQFEKQLERIRAGHAANLVNLQLGLLRRISGALDDSCQLVAATSAMARAHAQPSRFNSMLMHTQVLIVQFLEPLSAFRLSLVHRTWSDVLSPQDVCSLSAIYLGYLADRTFALCREHYLEFAMDVLRSLIRRREETASLAYLARLQLDAVFQMLLAFVAWLSMEDIAQLVGIPPSRYFKDLLCSVPILYSRKSTVQSARYDFSSPNQRNLSGSLVIVIAAWKAIDNCLTTGNRCRRTVLRHFAEMAAAANRMTKTTPCIAEKYFDEIGDLHDHIHWMFDFSTDCLDCPPKVRDWLRDKRKRATTLSSGSGPQRRSGYHGQGRRPYADQLCF
eukprot:TRINITY_DN29623_c0_g1_i1.p1 TRINITY_DN29623_c0_g1~~TRINITY_DN29623_c0_g1_i1.p1  ORF type:complete len:389 (+),score=31.93 TRINITY_DN29623_c0_g1_i1:599-1765(+)